MKAYYNEIDTYAAAWLRNLIAAGHIAPGEVDERSIEDIRPDDLRGFTQCHFFAGIGVWSHALRLAGWPDDRPVWTGSCPCQPFSAAGKGAGTADERHLWPTWFNLIRECRPDVVFGEQVEAAINHGWLDLVQSVLESEGYAVGSACIPACGIGAPHIRQRLWFVADASGADGELADASVRGRQQQPDARPSDLQLGEVGAEERLQQFGADSASAGELENSELSEEPRQRQHSREGLRQQEAGGLTGTGLAAGCQSDSDTGLLRWLGLEHLIQRPSPTNGHWGAADWLHCRDGKWRPVEPGTFPLAHGATARVGRLRAYGNAIVPQVAAEFIKAYLETRN
jgi:DNA (cytosine-5)-methyltransferase 1